jgi:hypothetical protein
MYLRHDAARPAPPPREHEARRIALRIRAQLREEQRVLRAERPEHAAPAAPAARPRLRVIAGGLRVR